MLPERISRLLTAYVDGELDTRQRQVMMRLLRRSSEARELLQGLEKDAVQLRGLPRQSLDQDFSQQVLQIIAGRKVDATRRSALTVASYIPTWLGLATAAAAVLLVVGLGSYVYFAAADRQKQAELLAVRTTDSNQSFPGDELVKAGPAAPSPAEPVSHESLGPPTPEKETASSSSPAAPRSASHKPETDAREAPLASPLRHDTGPLKDPPMRIALVFNFRDLDQEKQKQMLLQELRKEPAHGMELRCSNTLAGIERLQGAFKSQAVEFIIDKDARAILDLGMGTDSFALYVEDVTTEEMIAILQQLSSEDRKGETKRRGVTGFENLRVNAMARQEQEKSLRRLGIDILPWDARLPEREKLGRPAATTQERQALVVAYTPGRPRPMSAALKRFLESHKERRAGTLQILLVLSSARG